MKKKEMTQWCLSFIYFLSPSSLSSDMEHTGTALWKTQLDLLIPTVFARNPDVETPEVGHQTGARRVVGVGTATKINIWVKISSLY